MVDNNLKKKVYLQKFKIDVCFWIYNTWFISIWYL